MERFTIGGRMIYLKPVIGAILAAGIVGGFLSVLIGINTSLKLIAISQFELLKLFSIMACEDDENDNTEDN